MQVIFVMFFARCLPTCAMGVLDAYDILRRGMKPGGVGVVSHAMKPPMRPGR